MDIIILCLVRLSQLRDESLPETISGNQKQEKDDDNESEHLGKTSSDGDRKIGVGEAQRTHS